MERVPTLIFYNLTTHGLLRTALLIYDLPYAHKSGTKNVENGTERLYPTSRHFCLVIPTYVITTNTSTQVSITLPPDGRVRELTTHPISKD